jgi:hypothetical protein
MIMTARIVVELKQGMTESGLQTFLAQLDGIGVCSIPAITGEIQ